MAAHWWIWKRHLPPPEQRHIGCISRCTAISPLSGEKQFALWHVTRNEDPSDDIVELLGIEKLLNRYPITLSGGEKQRVAIGRALLTPNSPDG